MQADTSKMLTATAICVTHGKVLEWPPMKLKDKIKFAMDEGRMLNLGAQVLIGFGFQSVMQPGFEKLSLGSKRLLLLSLIGLVASLALVVAPASRDRLCEGGNATKRLHRYATLLMGWGLFPFALGLGASVYLAVSVVASGTLSVVSGVGVAVIALVLWYGGLLICRRSEVPDDSKEEEVELKDKITHALTEARMVLPGVQAMAGFQFIGMLTDAFERLPPASKNVHIVSLVLSAITICFLITPAAFHRIAERGEATDRQHLVTNRFLIAAMVTLPPAICGDLYVVTRKVTSEIPLSFAVSLIILAAFYTLWFLPGIVLQKRESQRPHEGEAKPST